MPDRIQRQSDPANRVDDALEVIPAGSPDGQMLRDEIDDLLDEIDDVLEENAEEFVKNYVQKGGQ